MSRANRIVRVIKGRRPKIVVIGGGTGLPVILKSLHQQNADITAIVTVADDGGSSGIIRDYINVVPPGDIRNVLVSLSDMSPAYLDIFQYRFESKDSFFAGHAIGNLIIAALTEMDHNIFDAVQTLSQMMAVDGHVYPVANEPLTLNAEFKDGSTAAGETEISGARKQIKRVWVTDTNDPEEQPVAVPPVIQAIMDADVIVLGPGSLFTSILPNLMVKNLQEALLKSSAEVIYICNIMTQKGETEHFSDADHVRIINEHLGAKRVDTILVNAEKVPDDYLDYQKYNEYLVPVSHDFNALQQQCSRIISNDFLSLHDHGVFHDGTKVAREILNRAFQPNH